MKGRHVELVKKEILQEYLDRTPVFQAHNQTAKQRMPSRYTPPRMSC